MVTLSLAPAVVWAAAPAPSSDRVDHADPDAALRPAPGDRARAIAQELDAATFEAKLAAISRWIRAHLAHDDAYAYRWRDFDRIVEDGRYGGCADYAVVYGTLARAVGIPTVFVKTMDADWIRRFRAGPEPAVWSGHVFLEVWDGSRWKLLDPEAQLLHDDYDPATRLLPGERFAYDKGIDPYTLVLSVRWEEWKEQTRAYFSTFDVAQLPVGSGRPLRGATVWIAGDNPGWTLARDRLTSLGWTVGRSGNTGFDDWLPQAEGEVLVLLSVGGREPLPEPYRSRDEVYTFAARDRTERSWTEDATAPDGTRVVRVYGADADALATAIGVLAP
jgi:hypothetical protein